MSESKDNDSRPDIYERSLRLHRQTQGKIGIYSRMPLKSRLDLSLAYTPGVARPCEVIAKDPSAAFDLTWKGRSVAVVSDGSAVLGLGDIGPEAALPVMEGKAVLFREFGAVDAVPLVLNERDPQKIIDIVRAVAPTYGGINLEDISAPRCYEIEEGLQDVGIPVLHDDQHGTAIVVLAAFKNALRVTGQRFEDLSVVINGAGAAGRAIARLLCSDDASQRYMQVGRLRMCDSKGILWPGRSSNNAFKEKLAQMTNPEGEQGGIRDALQGSHVFIGVSKGNLLTAEDIRLMAPHPIIFAMANPIPEIDPDDARKGGAAIVATGRSDYPNQVNNVLAFPGLFRGALDARATRFTRAMILAAIDAIAHAVHEPTPDRIIPEALDKSVALQVAGAVSAAV